MAKERKRRPLPWTDEQQQVLALAFEARYSSAQIAEKIATNCQIPSRTIRDWMEHPDFQAKLAEMRADILTALTESGALYVRKEQRIIGLAQMAESARVEYEARPWLKEVRPTTDGEIVNESFNRDAHAAFRGALDDIAKELGHRKPDKGDGSDAAQIRIIIETDHGDIPTVQVMADDDGNTTD